MSASVKYHIKSDQGVACLTDTNAAALAGEDADFHRRDLAEAIARGEAPSWSLYVQAIPYGPGGQRPSSVSLGFGPSVRPVGGLRLPARYGAGHGAPGPV